MPDGLDVRVMILSYVCLLLLLSLYRLICSILNAHTHAVHMYSTEHICLFSNPLYVVIDMVYILSMAYMTNLSKARMRLRVVHLHAQGLSNKDLARDIHKTLTYIDTWLKRYQLRGHVKDIAHTYRPRTLPLH